MTAPTRTEFEAAALPPLPEPAYWETMGLVYKDKTEAERVAWLTSETAGKSRPVYGVYTAGQMHEFRRTAIAAHAAQTERERFEAAAYRWLRTNPQWLGWEHDFRSDEVDREVAAAMGWPTVPEQAGWLPIETAPKDRPIFLSNGETVAQGEWLSQPAYIREHRDLEGHYIDQDEFDGFDGWIDYAGGMLPEPTHWMPLPPAPTVPEVKS